MEISLVLLPVLMSLTVSDGQSCGKTAVLQPGQNVTVTSPGFPGRYSPGTNCDWTFSLNGTGRLAVECDVIDLPESSEGCLDWVVYGTGEGVPSGTTCGARGLKYDSTSQKLSLSLFSDPRGKIGGKFSCRVTQKLAALAGRAVVNGCDCGYSPPASRIVGGTTTAVDEFPFMAALVTPEGLLCGASVVSRNFVLTAAHCVVGRSPDRVAVVVGDWDLSTGADNQQIQTLMAQSLSPHPGYNAATKVNDIGLVRTARSMVFGTRVGAVCIPWYRDSDYIWSTVQAVGWGTTSFGGPRSNRLQKVALYSYPKTECQAAYQGKFSPATQVCTYSSVGDACQFDSGGPILYFDTSIRRYFLLGVISYGTGCAFGKPSVNTKVNSYASWIYGVTMSDTLCSR